ncbi:interferon regulatory factor 3-like [Spea bombifrons]|uniref:interferon regulatory factor 3-like n=1 Tax=Spea bombifrons TaxID=233779 RepID=UPI00234B2CD3|nr:interferon regulatory factor 3-like [Spea bombifrons]
MSFQKPRIIPWLIEQIGRPEYPGLVWLNKERTQFRIPWKHGRRNDPMEDNFKIFKAWAIASGGYDPIEKPTKWKTNFRNALVQKHEIRMIKKNTTEDPDRIYEILVEEACCGSTANAASEEYYLSDVNPFSEPISFDSSTCSSMMTEALSGDLMNLQLLEEGTYFPDTPAQEPENVAENILLGMLNKNALETQFDVNIYYRGTLIKNVLVKNPCGLRITSRPSPGSHLEEVVLPIPAISDQKLANEIRKLLGTLEEGTLIEVRDGLICGKRQGKCTSYWSMTEFPTTTEPNPIDKNDYSILYSMEQFVEELIAFIQGERRESPQYSIWVCLGQEWPNDRPWKRKLIMVQITPVSMKMLHELSYCGGASSLHSDELNLQISDSLSLTTPADLLPYLVKMAEMMEQE